ncbi:MAG: multidrug efflux SMR transporter [Acidobacteria bacterium]|nr:multidrug efflux SMR transporter [Acidobacteriota bacterium]
MKYYIFLFIAIIFETIATTSLKNSEQFTRLVPSIITVLGYLTAFYFLSLTLNAIPVGVAYAIWSGIGIVLITLVGAIVFKQVPDLAGIVGLCLIVAGVVVVNAFSKMSAH